MVLSPDGFRRGSVWYPKSTVLNHIGTKLFRSNKESDVAFTVGSSGKLFKAHKCVLALSSATLYELVLTKSNDNNEESHEINITLADIDETVFEKILEFIYTGKYPDISKYDEESVKDIFLTADRLDCTDLKLYAESVLIEKHLVSSNAAEMMLFADSHSFALLKEASMNEYATDPKIVMASEGGWSKLTESKDLIIELLVYINLDRKTYSSVANSSPLEDLDTLDVTSLRERLQMANLDCDGSREMLVKRLKVDDNWCVWWGQ
ncbi:POZ domain-containing protein [Fragilariopsis cylindrus CCMP1102]|uniref:POZ domain-containing protein n=1 Tax=Fragilariopsis cylindrus CCMP1102 TaxID=635003 RepID=A0A1E7EV13_9STRA|nr:POZ domain-containing protein [Fragilariopsis cylindrus CCMP1102]|eukprot:OEU09858.1 POZ domain-containing protein [Fragilariopsis cylindrus CCMP1102]